MLLIKESTKNSSANNAYSVFLVNNETGESSLLKEICITSISKKIRNRDYYLLYDSELQPISPAFGFINEELLTKSVNTIIQTLSALKLLYSYLEMFDLQIDSLTKFDIRRFKEFLKGISPKGAMISFELSTNRTAETINLYLSIYRKYMQYLNIDDSPLFNVSPVNVSEITIAQSGATVTHKSYEENEPTRKKAKVPVYISVRDFNKIMDVVRRDYGIREECIVRLMFEGGLRIGEVLGLTAEDVKNEHLINERTGAEFDSGVIYIRNRFTDKKYQHAKRRIKVTNRRTYQTSAYKTDVQKAFVSTNLIDLIDEYINDSHDSYYKVADKSKSLFEKNYEKYTITDIVDPEKFIDNNGEPFKENYYIFINSLGKPLNISTWNKIIRDIFEKAGIVVDTYIKKNNLNHRFRHGFAMYLVQYHNIQPLQLEKALRHASLASAMIYYNPTDEDIAEIHNKFSETLVDLLPRLIEGRMYE